MKVHEQLDILTCMLEQAGWVRLNGNTWQSPDKTHTLHTAYVHGEVTLELYQGTAKQHTFMWYYRGAESLSWANTEAAPVLRKIFDKPLDKVAEHE